MTEQRTDPSELFGTGSSSRSVDVGEAGLLTVLKRQQRHWKSWLAAVALAATAGVLFVIGGWNVDTASFAVATLGVVA